MTAEAALTTRGSWKQCALTVVAGRTPWPLAFAPRRVEQAFPVVNALSCAWS